MKESLGLQLPGLGCLLSKAYRRKSDPMNASPPATEFWSEISRDDPLPSKSNKNESIILVPSDPTSSGFTSVITYVRIAY